MEDGSHTVEKHLKVLKSVRSGANINSRNTAEMMVQSTMAAQPPSVYTVGSEVLVRRFSSKSRKKSAGRGLDKRRLRVVKGTVTQVRKSGRYKVRYQFNGQVEEQWFPVTDITSVTYENEKNLKHQSQSKC